MSKNQSINKNIQILLSLSFILLGFFSFLFLLGSFITKFFSQKHIELSINNTDYNRAYIAGAVSKPGVYKFEGHMVVIELVELAGGFAEDADLVQINKTINLSEQVFNEDHIFIPFREGSGSNLALQNYSQELVNINTASSSELETLPGVGPSTATKIIQGRPYKQVDDLMNVKGIGEATFEKLKSLIIVK
ncbi:hypothetical protein GF362_01755 [Candidatus Dojkabacteria bacterium]|nr:hypothetical protein [Candidatus Dojkabacteria bacterium]